MNALEPVLQSACAPSDSISHTLHPGDVVCADRGERMDTLLGSCVAIILTDPRRTVGAMCHIVHSGPTTRRVEPVFRNERRVGDAVHAEVALAAMYRLLNARGIDPRQCEAYVFGGGNLFPGLVTESHVGEVNSRWAIEVLAGEGIVVLDSDLGGRAYRKLSWVVGAQHPNVITVPV